ncbi:MAG TPA: 30S ribosomal protein S11 [Patescibacteria group bacterium]|nr:30S ribosomal protein S11 [Patescibacteria group bacterium]
MANIKKIKKSIERGNIYITATFNNTLVTVTDQQGTPFVSRSCGMHGFSGTRKSTPYAATVTVQASLTKAMQEHNLREVTVYIKGIGPGREASLRAIKASGIEVEKIIDITPIPHNGVRPPKIRRG